MTAFFVNEIPVELEWDYQPEEKAWFSYRRGEGYPGCPESVTLWAAWAIDRDGKTTDVDLLYKNILTAEDVKNLEEQILDSLHDYAESA